MSGKDKRDAKDLLTRVLFPVLLGHSNSWQFKRLLVRILPKAASDTSFLSVELYMGDVGFLGRGTLQHKQH